MLERGAAKLGWRAVEFARVFSYDSHGRGVKQTMARTMLPRAIEAGAQVVAECRVAELLKQGRPDRRRPGASARCPDGEVESLTIRADHVFVCGGAIQTPTLLQHSGIRAQIGNGLKFHPTIKVAARFPQAYDHDDVPMHRVTEFSPVPHHRRLGQPARPRRARARRLRRATTPTRSRRWEDVVVYYAAIRSDGSGRVTALPGPARPRSSPTG